jgi:hypothetical protein
MSNNLGLLIKLPLYPLESLSSYFRRLEKANHIFEKNWYINLLNAPEWLRLDYLTEKYYSSVTAITNITDKEISNSTVMRFLPNLYHKPTSSFEEAGRIIHLCRISKICPICIGEKLVTLIPWKLNLVTTCLFHNVLLVDVCPNCSQKLTRVPEFAKCPNCNQLIAAQKVDDPLSKLYTRVIWSAIGCSPENLVEILKSCGFNFEMSAPQLIYYLFQASTLLHRLGNIKEQHNRYKPHYVVPAHYLSNETKHKLLSDSLKLLLNWPKNFYAFLEKVVKEPRKNTTQYSVGYMLSIRFSKSEYGWLWDAFFEYVRGKEENKRLFSCMIYQRKTNIERLETNFLGREEGLIQTNSSGMHKKIIKLKKVKEILGVSRGSVLAFIEAGLITPASISEYATTCYYEQEIFDLRSEILSHLKGPVDFEKSYNLFVSVMRSRFSNPVVTLIKSLLKDEIRGYTNANDFRLCELNNDESISSHQACTILSCNKPALNRWVRSGFFVPLESADNPKVCKYSIRQVLEFRDKMITTQEVAIFFKCLPYDIRNWVYKGYLKPVSGPFIDGRNKLLFDKNIVIEWRKNIMETEEVARYLSITREVVQCLANMKKLKPLPASEMGLPWFFRKDVEALKI